MPDRIELTWPDGDSRPMRIINPEIVRYVELVEKGGKITQVTRAEFTVCTARPATAKEIEAWRAQP